MALIHCGGGWPTCHISGKLLIFARIKRTVSKRMSPGTLGGKNASNRDMIARGDSRRRRAHTAETGFRRVLSGPAIIRYFLREREGGGLFFFFFSLFLLAPSKTLCPILKVNPRGWEVYISPKSDRSDGSKRASYLVVVDGKETNESFKH